MRTGVIVVSEPVIDGGLSLLGCRKLFSIENFPAFEADEASGFGFPVLSAPINMCYQK